MRGSGALMAATAKTGARHELHRARRVQRVRDRLIDLATANQPAPHDRLPFVVGRAIDAVRRTPRIVEHVERLGDERRCRRDGAAARSTSRQERLPGGRPRGRGRPPRAASRRSRPARAAAVPRVPPAAALPRAPGNGATRARATRSASLGRERRRQGSEAAPRHLHVEAVEDLALALGHPARSHHLQIATMPARGQAQREGDMVFADGALELAGEGAQRRHAGSPAPARPRARARSSPPAGRAPPGAGRSPGRRR